MEELCRFHDRSIHWLEGGADDPAVYYIADKEAGGILVNAPRFDAGLLAALRTLAEPRILFLPSRFGARDLARWREGGLQIVAQGVEGRGLGVPIDVALDSKTRVSRTIDFLPMSGRTQGTCALRLRNKPGAVFFGPILEPDESGWPALIPHDDDHSWENRLFGALGLKDLNYEYAFTDRFTPGVTPYGPGASAAIRKRLTGVLD